MRVGYMASGQLVNFHKHNCNYPSQETEKPKARRISTTRSSQVYGCSNDVFPPSANMSLAFRRFHSTSPASASSIATQFLSQTQSLPIRTHTQLLDGNQLQRLSATLSRSELSLSLPENGTPLPACYHLAYFTPAQVEEQLGRDGTDTTFNPPSPFTRRMWAGGELEWVGGASNRLMIGQEVREATKLVSAVGKRTKAGEEMVIVGVEKTYENENGIALIDKRCVMLQATFLAAED